MDLPVLLRAERRFSHLSDLVFIAGVFLRIIILRRIPVSTSYNVNFILKSLYSFFRPSLFFFLSLSTLDIIVNSLLVSSSDYAE